MVRLGRPALRPDPHPGSGKAFAYLEITAAKPPRDDGYGPGWLADTTEDFSFPCDGRRYNPRHVVPDAGRVARVVCRRGGRRRTRRTARPVRRAVPGVRRRRPAGVVATRVVLRV